MHSHFRKRFIATVLTGAATVALACGGAAAAHANPDATAHPDVSFVVPYTQNPASTGIPAVAGVKDSMRSDDLTQFSAAISCADGQYVAPPTRSTTNSSGVQLAAGSVELRFVLPVAEQGKVCTIHSSGPANRILNFNDSVGTWVRDNGDREVDFAGIVIENVTRRGGQY